MATVAPSWASRTATARPMPCEAPVTSAYWPMRREGNEVERSGCGMGSLRNASSSTESAFCSIPSVHPWDSFRAAREWRGQDLIEDDRAKGCGADPADRERTEFEREIAGARGQRHGDGDQVCRICKVDLILDPDPARHRRDQSEQHDRK